MRGVRTVIRGVTVKEFKAVAAVISSVLEHADPSWTVTLSADEDATWMLYAQPVDASSFSTTLTNNERTPERIREVIGQWYRDYYQNRRRLSISARSR